MNSLIFTVDDFSAIVLPGRKGRWLAPERLEGTSPGDYVLFCEPFPFCRIAGIGRITRISKRKNKHGQISLDIQYLNPTLPYPIDLVESREPSIVGLVSVVQSYSTGEVFRLTSEQSEYLTQLISQNNPISDIFVTLVDWLSPCLPNAVHYMEGQLDYFNKTYDSKRLAGQIVGLTGY